MRAQSPSPTLMLGLAVLLLALADPALAQNPFATATSAANTVSSSLRTFSLSIGGVGMVACLLLGFFGKLNWRWVWTGIGVAFAIALVPSMINWLAGLGSSSTTTT